MKIGNYETLLSRIIFNMLKYLTKNIIELISDCFRKCLKNIIKEQVAWNKSSLLLKIQKQNTQTLQLFTVKIRTKRHLLK